MATTLDIVTRAMIRINAHDPNQTLDATAAATALGVLNDMMHAWSAQGLTYEHTTLVLGDTFPLDDKFHKAVRDLLAMDLLDYFAPEADTRSLAGDARMGWAQICGTYFVVPKTKSDLPGRIIEDEDA